MSSKYFARSCKRLYCGHFIARAAKLMGFHHQRYKLEACCLLCSSFIKKHKLSLWSMFGTFNILEPYASKMPNAENFPLSDNAAEYIKSSEDLLPILILYSIQECEKIDFLKINFRLFIFYLFLLRLNIATFSVWLRHTTFPNSEND
ncbi:hypothetical protein GQX74_002158 [Glossina fuscipes]|nr:hypothetical protein GQX74_002158 [Glossina fuscipes]